MNDLLANPASLEGTEPETFGDHLRLWRRIRGLSQLQLSVRGDVSSRHVSFLESGRAKPSRQMVDTLADALDIPLRARNPMLLAAGFAPAYRETALEAPDASYIRQVLETVLKSTEPFPALVLDRHWRVLMTNAGGGLLMDLAGDDGADKTMFELMLLPGPMRDAIVNWDEVVSDVLKRVRREADHAGDDTVLKMMMEMLPKGWKPPRRTTNAVPLIIPLHMRLGDIDLRFTSIIGSLGTAADIGLAELSIETFLPTDEATEKVLREMTAS
ncbi:MAG: helix-turn-helix domain-containing protein [Candidatus Phaeomarinobacter sp.]